MTKKKVFDLRNAKEIKDYFLKFEMPEESRDYVIFHHYRFERLIKKFDEVLYEVENDIKNESITVLDIGPSFQTEILRQTLPERIIIDSLGFADPITRPRKNEDHIFYDLNDARSKEKWINIGSYNIILFAEVFEHLYISFNHFMPLISSWLKKDGYLVLEVPNGMYILKRLKMLFGVHPIVPLNEITGNSHFREPSSKEVVDLLKKNGYKILEYSCVNCYYMGQRLKRLIYNFLGRILPKNFSDDMIFIAKKIVPQKNLMKSNIPNFQLSKGLKAILNIQLKNNTTHGKGFFFGMAKITNIGVTAWKIRESESETGKVNLGIQLLNEAETLMNRDYFRYSLISSEPTEKIMPSEIITIDLKIPSPKKGTYFLKFDLVSENVTWFEQVGSQTVEIKVMVT